VILDGLRRRDFFVSAGTIPIKNLMEPTLVPPLAEWLVKFGSAEMVIAYSPDSPFFRVGEIKPRKDSVVRSPVKTRT
jgi:molybdate/tungstate transport system substrate-binding protein